MYNQYLSGRAGGVSHAQPLAGSRTNFEATPNLLAKEKVLHDRCGINQPESRVTEVTGVLGVAFTAPLAAREFFLGK
jgi:hypothetical protein